MFGFLVCFQENVFQTEEHTDQTVHGRSSDAARAAEAGPRGPEQ